MKPPGALHILYRGHARDLTSEGLLEALARLRRKDAPLAKRVERALKDLLLQLFPRARVYWWETSLGRAMRVALLPDNPHFQQDVGDVRQLLGIPLGEITALRDKVARERFPVSLREDAREKVLTEAIAS